MENCLAAWPDKDEILSTADRWEPPAVTEDCGQECLSARETMSSAQTLEPADVWAASMNVQWFKLCEGFRQLLSSKNWNVRHIAFSISEKSPLPGDRARPRPVTVHMRKKI